MRESTKLRRRQRAHLLLAAAEHQMIVDGLNAMWGQRINAAERREWRERQRKSRARRAERETTT